MPLKDIKITTVLVVTGGAIFAVAAIKGLSIKDIARSILQGKDPLTNPQTTGISVDNTGVSTGDTMPSGATPPFIGGGGTASANQAIARLLAAPYGWSVGAEWDALVKLWNQESGWNNKAKNPSSGAYGIPQALPESKLPSAGQESGGSDPAAQISWGLSYIKQRYGSPSAAWAHERAVNWY